MNELVSVIITTYNRLEWLKEAIKSVQDQSYPNIEIIVVDSSDNDQTKEYILKNDNIIYAHSGINHPNVMRNLGIQCSNGTWIAFLDDDDTWSKEKIAQQKNLDNMKQSQEFEDDREEIEKRSKDKAQVEAEN